MQIYAERPRPESRVIMPKRRPGSQVSLTELLQARENTSLLQNSGKEVVQRQQYEMTKRFPLNCYSKPPKDEEDRKTKVTDALRVAYPVDPYRQGEITEMEDQARGEGFMAKRGGLDPLALSRLRGNSPYLEDREDALRGLKFLKQKQDMIERMRADRMGEDAIAVAVNELRASVPVKIPDQKPGEGADVTKKRTEKAEIDEEKERIKMEINGMRDGNRAGFSEAYTDWSSGNDPLKRAKLQHLQPEEVGESAGNRNGNMADDVKHIFPAKKCGIGWLGGHLIKDSWGGLDHLMNVVVWDKDNAEKEWSEKFEDPLEASILLIQQIDGAQVEVSVTREDEIAGSDKVTAICTSKALPNPQQAKMFRSMAERKRWEMNRVAEKIPITAIGICSLLQQGQEVKKIRVDLKREQTGYANIEARIDQRFNDMMGGCKPEKASAKFLETFESKEEDQVQNEVKEDELKKRSMSRIESILKESFRLQVDPSNFSQDIESVDPIAGNSLQQLQKRMYELLSDELKGMKREGGPLSAFVKKLSSPEMAFAGELKEQAKRLLYVCLTEEFEKVKTQSDPKEKEKRLKLFIEKLSSPEMAFAGDLKTQAEQMTSPTDSDGE